MAWPVKRKSGRKTLWYVYDRVWNAEEKKFKDKCIAGSFKLEGHAKDYITRLKMQKLKAGKKIINYNSTLWEYCDLYQNDLRPRTISTKKKIYYTIIKIKAFFAKDYQIIDIVDGKDIKEFIKWLKAGAYHDKKIIRKPLNPTTIRIHMRDFSGILNMAVKDRIIDENPIKEIAKRNLEPALTRTIFLSDIDKEELFAAIMKVPYRHSKSWKRDPDINIEILKMTKTLIGTGLRIGELLNMDKADMIDRDKIKIRSSHINGYEHLWPTKSKKEYIAPLNDSIAPYFEEVESGRIFKGYTPDSFRGRFKKAAVLIGMPDLIPHSMRHTCASDLSAVGADLKVIKEFLHHSQLSTTDIYTHLQQNQLKEFANRVIEKKVKLKIA